MHFFMYIIQKANIYIHATIIIGYAERLIYYVSNISIKAK